MRHLLPLLAVFMLVALVMTESRFIDFAETELEAREWKPSKGCFYKGQRYLLGEKFADDCNRCMCTVMEEVACTRMFCKGKKP